MATKLDKTRALSSCGSFWTGDNALTYGHAPELKHLSPPLPVSGEVPSKSV